MSGLTNYNKMAEAIYQTKLASIQPEPIVLNSNDPDLAEKAGAIHGNKCHARQLLIDEITNRWSQVDKTPDNLQAVTDIHTLLYLMDAQLWHK